MAQNDNIQHGVDGDPNDDGKKGLQLGALGGGTVGAIAGAALGPVGAIVGGLIGGSLGSVGSGAAVEAVDKVDNDNTVSGLGSGAAGDESLRSGTANSGMDDAGMASNIHPSGATSATYAATTSPVDHVSGATNLNNAGQGYAADNNFVGDAFRASAGMGQVPDTSYAPTKDTYSGITAIGGYDQNADTAVVGGLGTNSTPGVRSDTPLPGTQSGTDESALFTRDADALSGDHMGVKTSGEVLNDPSLSIAETLRKAG